MFRNPYSVFIFLIDFAFQAASLKVLQGNFQPVICLAKSLLTTRRDTPPSKAAYLITRPSEEGEHYLPVFSNDGSHFTCVFRAPVTLLCCSFCRSKIRKFCVSCLHITSSHYTHYRNRRNFCILKHYRICFRTLKRRRDPIIILTSLLYSVYTMHIHRFRKVVGDTFLNRFSYQKL